jgi:hypothetical protein
VSCVAVTFAPTGAFFRSWVDVDGRRELVGIAGGGRRRGRSGCKFHKGRIHGGDDSVACRSHKQSVCRNWVGAIIIWLHRRSVGEVGITGGVDCFRGRVRVDVGGADGSVGRGPRPLLGGGLFFKSQLGRRRDGR